MQALNSTVATHTATDMWPGPAYRLVEPSVTPPTPLLARGGRMFCDANGTWWCVYESDCDIMTPAAGRCLVFESLAVVRRVRQVPAGWSRLSVTELEALSWQR